MKRPAGLTRNVLVLSLCQALLFSGQSLIVATSALVGFALAEDKSYATLPFASQLLATMLTSIPAAVLMSRIGRKTSFQIATLFGMAGAGFCTTAILYGSFPLFLTGSICFGIFAGFGNYYRFTAADSVEAVHKSRAIAYVMAGGVVAAFVGPNLANFTRELIAGFAFAGSYLSLIVLYVLSLSSLMFLELPVGHTRYDRDTRHAGRPLLEIAVQRKFIVAVVCGALGYSLMSLVMTATPLAMHHEGHAFSDSAFVIQWHVVGMFAPSFFTGHLINRFGLLRILFVGALAVGTCVTINLYGHSVAHYWMALTLLGVGWNFLFIGATTLLTQAYATEERFKSQALNDFIVFSMVATASLSAGAIHHNFGWRSVNYGAIPLIIMVLSALAWMAFYQRAKKATPVDPLLTERTEI